MCLVLQSEVILANVLSQVDQQCGVDRNELVKYCEEVKSELAKLPSMESEYVYFDVDEQSIRNAVKIYQTFFAQFGNKIFGCKKINVDYFNSRFNPEVSDTLKKSAAIFISSCAK
ncbi:hypothetical protein [Phosphitispora fastidiosa]|uniref:hypothetical protein n=1 Tax=Phosphitispora fastidiosa TaxID=2837202 RepID=UPI001E5D945B|nr:hypothetical protein [Phosphitispora fastidiosa]MBU7005894.1 hypothetical protein [Phosphitispora fastidiosa]